MQDLINATFLGGASLISLLNVRAILKDKAVAGVSPWPTVFFSVWGVWDLYYYPWLGQWLSGLAAFGMLAVNLTWLFLYRKYK